MSSEADQILIREAEYHEAEARKRRAAVKELQKGRDRSGVGRFAAMKPLPAILQYLTEENATKEGGQKRSDAEIIQALEDGGNLEGKRRGAADFSIRKNLEFGNLIRVRGGGIRIATAEEKARKSLRYANRRHL